MGILMRLLWVDSDQDYLEAVTRYFRCQGVESESELDSSKALSRIEQSRYDLVAGGWLMLPTEAIRFFKSVRSHVDERVSQTKLLCYAPEELDLEEYIALYRLNVAFISAYRSFDSLLSRLRMIVGTHEEAR